MDNKILLLIIVALLMGSGLLAADNSDAIQRFCKNLVHDGVEVVREIEGLPLPPPSYDYDEDPQPYSPRPAHP